MSKYKAIEPLDLSFGEAVKAVARGKTSRDSADKPKEGQPGSPRTQNGRGLRNHGTKFRIRYEDLYHLARTARNSVDVQL